MKNRRIIFRTSPKLDEFTFKKVCDRLENDLDNIDLEKINESEPDVTMCDLVLESFFKYVYKPVTQITGAKEYEQLPEYAYEFKDDYGEQFQDLCKTMPAIDALYDLVMSEEYSFIDDVEYNHHLGEYTDDPQEIDDMINDYMFEKAMEED